MNQKKLELMHRYCCSFVMMFFCIIVLQSSPIFGENLDVIENPKPTHIAKEFLSLVRVRDITDIDKNQFFARPHSMAVDDEGAIYLYDQGLKKILKLNKQYKWERNFGRQGQGPGEFSGNDWGSKKIYFSPDGNLYCIAPFNKKLIAFDKKGKHLQDIRLPYCLETKSIFPVVDKNKNLYSVSMNGGAVDVFDRDMKLMHTLLDKKDYQRFLFYPIVKPHPKAKYSTATPSNSNTLYNILPGGELVVFITLSSRAYIYNNNKMINHFDFWPKKAIEMYFELNGENIKKRKNGSTSYVDLIYNMIPDMDDPGHFYLQSFPGNRLYKLNLDGELIHALEIIGGGFRVQAKRHGLFYGFSARHDFIRVFKIKKEKKQ